MPSPIKRGRYVDETQIIDAIDNTISEIHRLRLAGSSFYGQADKAMENYKASNYSNCTFLAEKEKLTERGDAKMKKAKRIEDGRLRYLKGKLAVFRTELLPNVGIDRSISR